LLVECSPLKTHAEVAAHPLVAASYPLLADAAWLIGDFQIRNRGTIGGSLAHADPSADYPVAMLALEARMVLSKAGGGRRVVGADQFFVGPLTAGRARRDGDSALLTSLTVCTWSRVRCRSSGGHSLAFGCREIRTYSACRRPGGLPRYRRKRWQAP
jgi:FAD binding domain in molybdopterin dehydrogenase